MPIQAVVFDAFDTLVRNTRDLWRASFAEICAEQGIAVNPGALYDAWATQESAFRRRRVDLETMTASVPFQTYREAWRDALVYALGVTGAYADPDAFVARFIHGFAERPVFPETAGALEELGRRVPLAVLSNADDAFLYPVLERHGLTGAFATVLSSEEARCYKPHPDIFARILARLGTPPAATLMVGDTLIDDVYGARLSGMPGAWIDRTGAPNDSGVTPDYVIHSLGDLLPIVVGEPVGG